MMSLKFISMVCATSLLAACGGGGNGAGFAPLPSNAPQSTSASVPSLAATPLASEAEGRGSLIVSPPAMLERISPDQFALKLEAHPVLKQLLISLPVVGGTSAVACGIELRELEYRTSDAKGEITNANGVIMVPTGDSPMCTGPRPVVLYAHGTWFTRDYSFTKLTDPKNPAAPEGMLVASVFASRGYIVVASNYAGYGKSKLPYHPYLNGDQQGKDVVDALTAARKAFPDIGAQDSGKLLVTGISQGGYVAMAAHRELQAAAQPVTASAAISAPSAISLLMDHNIQGLTSNGAAPFFPLLANSWQQQFGDLYADPAEMYEARYANGIESTMPASEPTLNDVFASGKLPVYEVFPEDDKPSVPNPWYKQHGSANLIRSQYLKAMLADLASNSCPDNAMPALATLPELEEKFVDYRLSGASTLVQQIKNITGIDLTVAGSVSSSLKDLQSFIGTIAPDAGRALGQVIPVIDAAVPYLEAGAKRKLPSEEVNTATANPGAANPLDCKPKNGMRKAAVANDLRNWTPQRPMLMCGGGLDPTLSFRSTLATAAYFRAQGVPAERLKVIDLEQTPAADDPFAFSHHGFKAASALRWQSLDSRSFREKTRAVLDEYHPALVSPFCLVAARSFFEMHNQN